MMLLNCKQALKLPLISRLLSTQSPVAVIGNTCIKSVVNKTSYLELTISDLPTNIEKTIRFNPHWLRFNCNLSNVKGSGQRFTRGEDMPENLTIKNVKLIDENAVIEWNDESKQANSHLTLTYLLNFYPEMGSNENRYKPCLEVAYFDYSKFHKADGERNYTEILKWLQHVVDYGMCVLKNVGIEENTVTKVAEIIAPVTRNIYGEQYDIKAEPQENINNIASLTCSLPFHVDIPYYESPPGLQMLHCLQFDETCEGGESLILDAFLTLEEFRKEFPVYFDNLAKLPGSWKYQANGILKQEIMIYSKPHITLNHHGQLIGFRWSPNQEAPLTNLNEEQVKDYYQSYIALSKFLKASKNRIEFRLKPGELLIFNNRRCMHGRNSFTALRGQRHLQGIYLNMDEFLSTYRLHYIKSKLPEEERDLKITDLGKVKLPRVAVGHEDYS